MVEAGVSGKCKGMKTCPLHEPYFFYCRDRTEDTSNIVFREADFHLIKNTLFIYLIILII